MKKYLTSLILIPAILFPFSTLSQDEENILYYDVEIIIFENKNNDVEIAEIWKKSGDLLIPEDSVTLGRPLTVKLDPEYNPKQSFKLLAAEDLLLKEEIDSLKQSENYKILLHTGWRQPGMPREKALSVNFKHAIAEIESAEETTTGIINPEQTGTTTKNPEQADSPEPAKITGNLQGVIKIILSRYLHTDIELVYKKTTEDFLANRFDADYLENRAGKSDTYYLKQLRRMRSKELHYIDHPVIGVLLKITPHNNGKPLTTS
ncbi:MAG: peptidoglycan binding protein CsiV [Gammaproteobacteria bacterium]|nr:peptidoglycan binding protein CsiV [Gammaproteobacteria bacterium]